MDVVVVNAVRSPVGARNGALSNWHAVDLLATVLGSVLDGCDLTADDVDLVLGACATPVGEQALNITRNAVLAAGWPEVVAAATIDGQAASGVIALHQAAAALAAGQADVAVVAGVESMTRVPAGATTGVAVGKPFGPGVHERYADGGGLVPPGAVAERMARRSSFVRADLDAWAQTSRARARRAADEGLTGDGELVALHSEGARPRPAVGTKRPDRLVEVDELVPGADLAALRPAFDPEGMVTVGNVAQPADVAVALTLVRADTARDSGLAVLARLIAGRIEGSDPVQGGSGASVARSIVGRAGLELDAIDRWEVHEESASAVLALVRDLGLDVEQVNPDGGALALGDPLGAGGLREIVSLVHGLRRGHEHGRIARGVHVLGGSGGAVAATMFEG